jgi:uncharacterized protein
MDNHSIGKLSSLRQIISNLYETEGKDLLFHGWHHINFVRNKALIIGRTVDADLYIVETSALVHDLNYIVKKNSKPSDGFVLMKKILGEINYSTDEIKNIEKIIGECYTAERGFNISLEGKVLSDADTLFKALPITPILFSSKFITENNTDLKKLATKVVNEQEILMKQGIYFYTEYAKSHYLKWAKSNLKLWRYVNEALEDTDVLEMINIACKNNIL